MTAGQISYCIGTTADLIDELSKAQLLLADRNYHADCFMDALKEEVSSPASRAENRATSPSNAMTAEGNVRRTLMWILSKQLRGVTSGRDPAPPDGHSADTHRRIRK